MIGEGKEVYYGLSDLNWRRPGRAIRIILVYVILAAGALVFLLPFFWMVTTALKEQSEVYVFPPQFFPKTFRWQNFPEGWNYQNMQFTRWLLNTLMITVSVLVGVLVLRVYLAHGFLLVRP